jgi:hypothetical protein
MTPLAATITSSVLKIPRCPACASASPTARSSFGRSLPLASGTLSKTVVMIRSRTAPSSKTSPNAAASSRHERDEGEDREEADLRGRAMAAVVDELQRGALRRDERALGGAADGGARHRAHLRGRRSDRLAPPDEIAAPGEGWVTRPVR